MYFTIQSLMIKRQNFCIPALALLSALSTATGIFVESIITFYSLSFQICYAELSIWVQHVTHFVNMDFFDCDF